jgi:UDP-N-acetylglucosamine--N-acetylmuramyl-(pentapeptide) pyrophosphoryl-undecaprenol N-acetylglucosamine transferase
MRFLFACGGTAGHINPALAIATQLRLRYPESKTMFVGAGRTLEKSLIPRAGFHIVNIKMSGLRRGFSPSKVAYNINTIINLKLAGYKARDLLERFKPDIVIGTGGYICYPVLKKAAKMRIPTIIHDSNAIPGLTTKLLSGIVNNVLVAFPNQEMKYKKPDIVLNTGTPVRAEFTETFNATAHQDKNKKPLVVSFWGSLGAERMNTIISEIIKLNIESDAFNHIHAVGKKGGVEEIKAKLEYMGFIDELPQGIDIREYIKDMPLIMRAADIVLCRGGGSTIAELRALNKPAIIVPSPYVANNEQEHNANELVKIGAAILIDEKTCTGKGLFETITSLLGNKSKLKEMSEKLKELSSSDATTNVIDVILKLISNGK